MADPALEARPERQCGAAGDVEVIGRDRRKPHAARSVVERQPEGELLTVRQQAGATSWRVPRATRSPSRPSPASVRR